MDKMIGVMFKLLRSVFNKEEQFSSDEIKTVKENLKPLFLLSKKHDIAHLIGYALLKNNLIDKQTDAEVYAKFNQEQVLAVFRYERINYTLNELCDAFENAQIEFIPLKGSVIRDYYPEPWMRTSCDIDILIHESDLEKAVDVLTNNYGYIEKGKDSHDVSLFSPNNTHLELHYTLIEEDEVNSSAEVLKNVWKYAESKEGLKYHKILKDEYFYFYHIAHMAKHFLIGGCGIRTFLDLCILQNIDKNVENRNKLLKQGRLLAFETASKKLSEAWFLNKEMDEVCFEMEEYVLNGGVYGSEKNRVNIQQTKKGGKFKYAMSRIFLSYNYLKFQYPILQKHRWLMPICQVRRWFRLLFCGGAKRSMNELKLNQTLSENQKEKASRLIDALEL